MAGALEFIYTSVLKHQLAKRLVNNFILVLLPKYVRVGRAKVIINPADPVISGALTFGVYENSEISFMKRVCKAGQVMVDVGANVGIYTAIAGLALGPSGRVIALEPHPESFRFLQQTIRANNINNTKLVMAAASNTAGQGKLFTSSTNRGDNRLYDSALADGAVEVELIRLDDYLAEQGIKEVDIVKIDVQGFEGRVFEGLEQTIRNSPGITILAEFWPLGLASAGTDSYALLSRLEQLDLTLYELAGNGKLVPIADKHELIARYPGRKYTNLVLLGPSSANECRAAKSTYQLLLPPHVRVADAA